MFQQASTYPTLPQRVIDQLRRVNGITLPKFVKETVIPELLTDIEVVIAGDYIIRYFPQEEAVWIDAIFDAWIHFNKDETKLSEITDNAIARIENPLWWCVNWKKKVVFNYKDYRGQAKFDDDNGMFCGRVLHINDVVTFKGNTVKETQKAFQDSVDDYLEFCKELAR